MLKCSLFSNLSLKKLRILSAFWVLLALGLQLFLLVTSCSVLSSYPSNQIFITLCVLSLLSAITLVSLMILSVLISKYFNNWIKYLMLYIFLSCLGLAGGQLYFAIYISNLSNYLKNQLSMCGKSQVFAELYWEYKKLYFTCLENVEICSCFYDKNCAFSLIVDFYNVFKCNGFCDIGKVDCAYYVSNTIVKIGTLLTALTSIGFVFLLFSAGFVVFFAKFKKTEEKSLSVIDKSIRNFQGISAEISNLTIIQANLSHINSPSLPQIQIFNDDLSSIHQNYTDNNEIHD